MQALICRLDLRGLAQEEVLEARGLLEGPGVGVGWPQPTWPKDGERRSPAGFGPGTEARGAAKAAALARAAWANLLGLVQC